MLSLSESYIVGVDMSEHDDSAITIARNLGCSLKVVNVLTNKNAEAFYKILTGETVFKSPILMKSYNDYLYHKEAVKKLKESMNNQYGTVIKNEQDCASYTFDIIKMIEDKYGPIPAEDKVKWIKDNIEMKGGK